MKVEMAGICGTDMHQQRGELTIKPPLPNIQGHETIGRIVKLGEGRTIDVAGEPLNVGDRIMWAHADCGECYWCEVAREQVHCAKRSGYGFAPPAALRGGFAEYEYVTPLTKVVKVPEELDRGRGHRRRVRFQERGGRLRKAGRGPFPGERRDPGRRVRSVSIPCSWRWKGAPAK